MRPQPHNGHPPDSGPPPGGARPNGRVTLAPPEPPESWGAEELAATLDSAGTGIWALDLEGRCVFINQAACQALGYTREECLGEKLQCRIHTGHCGGWACPQESCRVQSALEGRCVAQVDDDVFRRRDGTPIAVKYYIQPVVVQGRAKGSVVTMVDITARKSAEEALRKSDEWLDFAQHAAGVGIFDLDIATGRARVSEGQFRNYGMDPAGIWPLHGEWRKLVHPDDRERLDRHHELALSGEGTSGVEFRVVWPDGSIHWLYSRPSVLRDDAGRPAHMVGVNVDITSRVQAEIALNQFFSASPTPMAVWGLDGRIQRANPAWEPMLGFTEAEFEGRLATDFVHPDDRAVAAAEIEGIVNSGARVGFECRGRCKDGSYRWLLVNAAALTDAQVIYVTAQDITERKNAEEAARRSAEWLQFTLNAAGIGLCYRDGGETKASEQQFRLYGLEPAGDWLSRERWLESIHPEDRERVDTRQRHATEQSEPYDIQFRAVLPDGGVRWLLCRGKTFSDGGNFQKVEITVDVTERKRAEAALAEFFNMSRSPMAVMGFDGRLKQTNAALLRTSGFTAEELDQRPAIEFFHPEDTASMQAEFGKLATSGGGAELECRGLRKDGSPVWFLVSATAVPDQSTIFTVAHDITDRKTAETYRDISSEALRILNEQVPLRESLQRVLAVIKARTGFDAVGIRLKEDGDYPYFAQDGLPDGFLATENSLIERGPDGGVCRDKDGHVSLECTCGLVMSGQTDASNPLYTEGGTFWTNDSFLLLDLPPDQDPRHRPRNRCMHHGYRSMALVPIRTKDRIIGLLQLNDHRRGCFSPAAIEHLEDITAHIGEAILRKQAEEALRESREILEAVLNTIPARVFWKDRDLVYLGCNESFARDAGFEKPADIIGKNDHATSWREQAERYQADDRAIVESGASRLLFEEPQTTPSGEQIYLLTSKVPLRDAGGATVGLLGTYFDITERKQALEKLRESEERNRTIIETAMDGFWRVDAQGRLLEVNEAYCRMSGYSQQELLAMRIPDLEAIETEADTAARIRQIMTKGEHRFESRHRRKDGSALEVEVSVLYRSINGGQMVAFLHDITARKQMENAVQSHAEKLARSNAELERFAYVASHDLQEPLRMVASFTQLLSKRYSGKLDETADRYIDYAVDGAKRMQQLITDLLVYSRVNSKEIAPRECDGEALIAAAMMNLKVAIEESGASVECDELPEVWVDQAQFVQLFQNLLGNAIKFTPKGTPPRIHISAADRGEEWLFSVRDNGIGIEPKQAERVFQIFQRLHTRAEYPGTGIGLAVCQKVVERHGGKIWVESEPGAGSTFRFTIPKHGRIG